MAHPVVTPVHDMHRDLFQPVNMVENVVIVAIRLAADTAHYWNWYDSVRLPLVRVGSFATGDAKVGAASWSGC